MFLSEVLLHVLGLVADARDAAVARPPDARPLRSALPLATMEVEAMSVGMTKGKPVAAEVRVKNKHMFSKKKSEEQAGDSGGHGQLREEEESGEG